MISLDEIRAGLNQGEFFLEYLPTVSLSDGRCLGAEALIRWQRPTGIIQPDDFIPIAENTPLSGLITYWVIETVASEMTDWLRANPEAHISINVPPEILGRGGLEHVANSSGLLEFGSQLVMEITERGVPDLLGVEAINSAWQLGTRIALDDVTLVGGTNLAILARCSFDITKIDISLVSQISPQSASPEWLEGITALLGSSRMEVIAEGVETEQQLISLRIANIQAAQGFYFSHPIPAADFIAYHKNNPGSDPSIL